jgi:hypothetical protein
MLEGASHIPNGPKDQFFQYRGCSTSGAARKMMMMVNRLGKDYLGGTFKLSCWTCHRGAAKPERPSK